jgi:hypothetical protein
VTADSDFVAQTGSDYTYGFSDPEIDFEQIFGSVG